MTDEELIARLQVDEPMCEEHFTANLAADRIKALIAERDALQAWKRYWSGEYDTALAGRADEYDRAEAAEAKLAKAVEALKYYAVEAMPWDADDSLIARSALVEIKSHSDEFATQKGESHDAR